MAVSPDLRTSHALHAPASPSRRGERLSPSSGWEKSVGVGEQLYVWRVVVVSPREGWVDGYQPDLRTSPALHAPALPSCRGERLLPRFEWSCRGRCGARERWRCLCPRLRWSCCSSSCGFGCVVAFVRRGRSQRRGRLLESRIRLPYMLYVVAGPSPSRKCARWR